jgi:2-polyprenyl-3-methyl-5-hydroxy-6-metoxy-1,4-benzoquinol methylase
VKRPKIIGDRLGAKLDGVIRKPVVGTERPSDWYDRMFSRTAKYQVAYHDSPYYFLWAVIADRVRHAELRRVLEVGCGTGQLAAFLFDQGIEAYVGIDFSSKAVEYAARMAPAGRFLVDDARHSAIYEEIEHDVVICTEVLEHIEEDLSVVSRFPPRTRCMFSVPNYNSESHVRFFRDAAAVSERYGDYFTGLDIAKFPVGSQTASIVLADGFREEFRSSS